MAEYRFHVGQKLTGVASAGRTMAYLERTGEYAPKDRTGHEADDALAYLERTSEDTVERGDFVAKTHGNMPDWSRKDPRVFFGEAASREGGGPERARRWATTWQLALPRELSRAEQWAMGTQFVAAHLQRHAYEVVMHDPVKDGKHQPHLHVIFSERIDPGPSPPVEVYFRKPELGGGGKDRWFSQKASINAMRHAWSDWTNFSLERHGHTARVHPGNLYERGIDRKPEPKLGYSQSEDARSAQQESRTARDRDTEQAQARAAWDARKQILGITNSAAMALDVMLTATRDRARGCTPGSMPSGVQWHSKSERRLERVTRALPCLEHEIVDLEAYTITLATERQAEAAAVKGGRARPVQDQWKTEGVLAAGVTHGLPRDPEAEKLVAVAQAYARLSQAPTTQPKRHALQPWRTIARRLEEEDKGHGVRGVRVRLHDDEEHERQQGMGY